MIKKYTSEFKAKAVIEILRKAKTINEIAAESGVHGKVCRKYSIMEEK